MENEGNEGFNIQAAADEIIAEGDSQSSSTEDSSQSAGQSSQDSQNAAENTELSAEDILNQVGEQKEGNPEQFADLLKAVEGLGAVHHGAPIKVDTPEKLKQLLEMGAGFYQKTEAHANELKAKEAEFLQKETAFTEREQSIAQKEQAFEKGQQFNNLMMDLIEDLAKSDPELFEHIDGLYQQREKAFHAQFPLQQKYDARFAELDNKFKSIEQQKQSEELKGIKQTWEKDLSEVQTKVAASLSKLGVAPDWNKVKEAWTSDASGKMTVEQALYATYGADIQKAHQSQLKLLETKNKTNAKLLGRTGVGQGQSGGKETIVAEAVGDYRSILTQASQTM
jgi:hypothetical protein